MPGLVRAVRTAAPVAGPAILPPLRSLASLRRSTALLRLAGVINGETQSLRASVRAVLSLDYAVYAHMVLLADEHDAEDVLAGVAVPTLVVAGDRDAITRPALARRIADRIPGSVYREVAGATHYGLMEYPELYAEHIGELLSRIPDRPVTRPGG